MSARWWTLGVWALVAASAVFWGLKLFVKPPLAPPQTRVADGGAPVRGDLSRLLGVDAPVAVATTAPEPVADARFQLLGVVSPRAAQAAREGLALIAVDGKPAKAFRVGAVVDGQTVLQSVGAREAKLGPRDGAAQVALNIAPPAAAATGILQTAGRPPGALAPAMPVQQQAPQQQPNPAMRRGFPQPQPAAPGTPAQPMQQPVVQDNLPTQ